MSARAGLDQAAAQLCRMQLRARELQPTMRASVAGPGDGPTLRRQYLVRCKPLGWTATYHVRIFQPPRQRPLVIIRELGGCCSTSVNNVGSLGRREDALAAIQEAVTIRRELAAARPDVFRPDLAGSLNNLAECLGSLSRREDALAAIEEAVRICRELAGARPGAFGPLLATSLNNLANDLGGLGRREDALAAIEEAVTIRRELAARWPDAHYHELNESLRVVASLELGEGLGAASVGDQVSDNGLLSGTSAVVATAGRA